MEDTIGVEEVSKIVGLSRMSIWRYRQDPSKGFPEPEYDYDNGRNMWSRAAIIEWQDRRRRGHRRSAYSVTGRNVELVEPVVEQNLRAM